MTVYLYNKLIIKETWLNTGRGKLIWLICPGQWRHQDDMTHPWAYTFAISHITTYLYNKLKEQWIEYRQRQLDMAHAPRAVKIPGGNKALPWAHTTPISHMTASLYDKLIIKEPWWNTGRGKLIWSICPGQWRYTDDMTHPWAYTFAISHMTTYLYNKLKEQWIEYWQRQPDMAHVSRAMKVAKMTGPADFILATWSWKQRRFFTLFIGRIVVDEGLISRSLPTKALT